MTTLNQPAEGAATALAEAIAFHQAGNLAEAARCYRQIIATVPDHFDALHYLGVLEAQRGGNEEALRILTRALQVNPQSIEAHMSHSNVLQALGRLEESLASCDRALAIRPGLPAALYNRGNILLDLNRREEALASYDAVLTLVPDNAAAWYNRGNVLQMLERHEEALASYDRVVELMPDSAPALYNRGVMLMSTGRHEEALASYDRALAIEPGDVDALTNHSIALYELGRYALALAGAGRALELSPGFIPALNNHGNILREMNRPGEALASFDKALAINPQYGEAWSNRGIALQALRRNDEALASYDRALALDGDNLDALINRANALWRLGRLDEALASSDRALALQPDHPDALANRGIVLQAQYRAEDALASFDRALALNPAHAQALYSRGNLLLHVLNRPQDALAEYERVLTGNPDHADALYARGLALQSLNRLEEAIASCERALEVKPGYEYAAGFLLHLKMRCAIWDNHEEEAARLAVEVRAGKRCAAPFAFLGLADSAGDQIACARTWMRDQCPTSADPVWKGERYRHDRIRVAYFSADLHEHPVAYLLAGLFEQHDRARFETMAFSFGPDAPSQTRDRLKGAFERFIEVGHKSEREIAGLARQLEVDIAVDLMGYTQNCRTGIFAARAAPVQVNYLGYAGTMGTDYIDYILADRIVIPEEQRIHYAEQVVYLPDTFQANDSQRRIAARTPTREEAGLPNEGFVFCSFNHSYKITPDVFAAWMRVLRKIAGSVLWLQQCNAAAVANLRRMAAEKGVAADRIIFAPNTPLLEDHLARCRLADLALDTLPYNAHATASDALWAGVPVLTCPGTAYAGRVAASVLQAVGLPELVTRSLDEYEELAIKLATDVLLLAGIKARLLQNRGTRALFDTDRFRRHIEAAYLTMWERHQLGKHPASFAVQPAPQSANRE